MWWLDALFSTGFPHLLKHKIQRLFKDFLGQFPQIQRLFKDFLGQFSQIQGPNMAYFETRVKVHYCSTLRFIIMKTSTFYRNSQTTIKTREQLRSSTSSQRLSVVLCNSDGRLCVPFPTQNISIQALSNDPCLFISIFFSKIHKLSRISRTRGNPV